MVWAYSVRARDIIKKIKELEQTIFISIEERFTQYILEKMRVSGYGVIVKPAPSNFHNKFYRRRSFKKKGSIIGFNNVPVLALEKFRDNILFLVHEAKVEGTRIDLETLKKVYIVYYEVARRPHMLKYRFKPWKIYSGSVKYGKNIWSIKWFVQVPTHDARSIMFLCSRDNESAVKDMIVKYLHMKYGNKILSRTEIPTAILFS